ncbi:MAG: hypothetical protein ACO1OF_02940 [Adhaeribacter sp.]
MQEYLFNKEELRRLIEESTDDQNRIAVRIDLKRPQDKIWARATRYEPGTITQSSTDSTSTLSVAAKAAGDGEVPGCPNPPGC